MNLILSQPTSAPRARAPRSLVLLLAASVVGGVALGQSEQTEQSGQSGQSGQTEQTEQTEQTVQSGQDELKGGVFRGTIEELQDVGIDQHLEALLPLDTVFVDSSGESTTLGSYFDGEHPVILTLNYIDCPQLCSLQLSDLTSAMAKINNLSLGEDYRVLTISIDPRETVEKAAGAKARYVGDYLFISEKSEVARPESSSGDAGWSYLIGDKAQIDRVAEVVGFRYHWVESRQEYAHAASSILCSPDGQITRYLPGPGLANAGTLKLALVEAGEGKIGTLFENAFLTCFIFDPNTGQYTLAVMRLLKVAAALTVLAVVTGIFIMRRNEAQRAPLLASAAGAHGGSSGA